MSEYDKGVDHLPYMADREAFQRIIELCDKLDVEVARAANRLRYWRLAAWICAALAAYGWLH